MNAPAIRAALQSFAIGDLPCRPDNAIEAAFVRVGLRACDEWDEANHVARNAPRGFPLEGRELAAVSRLSVIADILRDAGVEVEG